MNCWQGGVGHGGDRAFAEVIVIQAENSSVRAEPKLVRAVAPGQVVINEEPRCTPSLDPRVVEPSEGRKRRVGATALQNNRKCGQRLLKIAGAEQAFIPGKAGIEVVHQILRKNVRVSRRQGVQRLWGNRIEERIDRVGVGRLQARVRLKTKPRRIIRVDDCDRCERSAPVRGRRWSAKRFAGWRSHFHHSADCRRRPPPTSNGHPSTARGVPLVFP